MKTSLPQTCNDALSFILSQPQQNTFYTGLIMSALSLSEHPDADRIKQQGASFLLGQKSEQWSFNYCLREGKQLYPDDFDDTCIALHALYSFDSRLITEQTTAAIVGLLIAHETMPGGPYQTWITPPHGEWGDIDIVVNANIALFLSDLGVATESLTGYFDNNIEDNIFSSRYYHHELVIVYFLSQAYQGKHADRLIEKIQQYCHDGIYDDSPLLTALAVTALLRLGSDRLMLTASIVYLLESHNRGQWPSQPFFIESKAADTITYSSCDAHVSACCIEALLLYQQKVSLLDVPSPYHMKDILVAIVHKKCADACSHISPLLQQQLAQSLSVITGTDAKGEIALLSHQVISDLAIPHQLSEDLAIELGMMNTLGWIGYGIYDDILDGADSVALLPLATVCSRMVATITHHLIPHPEQYATIQRIIDGIASATAWEYSHCRLQKHDEVFELPVSYPDYGNYHYLAEKSLGHALGPIIVCMICDKYDQAAVFEHFFRHYLIARQLHDDAHDWQEDLQHGYLNSVSTVLLSQWQKNNHRATIVLEEDMLSLQELFWHHHIDIISNEIITQCTEARALLKKITMLNEVIFLEALLTPLEQSARQAVQQRDSTERLLGAIEKR